MYNESLLNSRNILKSQTVLNIRDNWVGPKEDTFKWKFTKGCGQKGNQQCEVEREETKSQRESDGHGGRQRSPIYI